MKKIETGVLTKHKKKAAFGAATSSKAKKVKAEEGRESILAREAEKKSRKVTKETIKEEIKAEMKKEVADTFIAAMDLKSSDTVELGGVDRSRHDANILRLEWAIKFPLLTPQEFLLHEKDYSVSQAHKIFEVSGGESEWRDEREKILNGISETMIKRNVDKLVEMNDTHIKLSQLGLAKVAEMLTKLQCDPVLDADGKLMIDPRTKRPIYRGFRSIDLVNCMTALNQASTIQRRAYGLANDVGQQQIAEALKASVAPTINIQNNNMTIVETPQTKMEQIIDKLEYEDIAEMIKQRRAMKAIEIKPDDENNE